MDHKFNLSERWRLAALEPYTDTPTSDSEWLEALQLGADAAVLVVLEHLIDRAKTEGDSGAVEAMYDLEADLTGRGAS